VPQKQGGNMSEKVTAAVDFLNDYAANYRKRTEAIESLEKKSNTLKPAVEEHKKIKSKIEFLKQQNKEDKDFLLNMKSMLEKNYPVEINLDDPTLFDGTEKENKDGQ
jgi:prefoldin subunit 5